MYGFNDLGPRSTLAELVNEISKRSRYSTTTRETINNGAISSLA